MKGIYFLSFLYLFTISCKKSSPDLINSAIIGKWTYTEYFYSTGAGPGQWHPVIPPNQTIEFRSDGSFIPSTSFLKEAKRFELVDSITIKFTTSSRFIIMGDSIDVGMGELYLYPIPGCIEGCNNKFRRQ